MSYGRSIQSAFGIYGARSSTRFRTPPDRQPMSRFLISSNLTTLRPSSSETADGEGRPSERTP